MGYSKRLIATDKPVPLPDAAYAEERKRRILHGLDIHRLSGLEIGPLASPIVEKDRGKVLYADHCSTDELRTKYAGQVPVNSICDIDCVWVGSLREAVGGITFDYVIASHVMEHIPNPVGWLLQVKEVLRPGGKLCLVIPDKRFTFDIGRPLSTVGEFVEASLINPTTPSIKQVFDNYTLARRVNKKTLWAAPATAPQSLPHLHPRGIATTFVKRVMDGEYVDCHCWIFTPRSFLDVLEALIAAGLTAYSVSAFFDTVPGQHEFVVQLQPDSRPVDSLISDVREWKTLASGPPLDNGMA
jgi:SAM-dependent methyltransferase